MLGVWVWIVLILLDIENVLCLVDISRIFYKIICIVFSDWINIVEVVFFLKCDIEYIIKCNSFIVLVD